MPLHVRNRPVVLSCLLVLKRPQSRISIPRSVSEDTACSCGGGGGRAKPALRNGAPLSVSTEGTWLAPPPGTT